MEKAETIYIEEPKIEDLPIPDLDTPPEGKAWRRKIDGVLYTGSLFLGMRYFGKTGKLKVPVKEMPEDFELVDIEPKI